MKIVGPETQKEDDVAISPPSDLVLDVIKAADPGDLVAARDKLRANSAANDAAVMTASNAGFASMIGLAESAASKAGLGNVTEMPNDQKVPETYRKFEASILSTFIQDMMPSDSEAVYGEGAAGDFWKSMMAEQVADAVSKRGGIGIAEQIYSQMVERSRGVAPKLATNETDRNMAFNMVTEFQRQTLLSPKTDADNGNTAS